MCSDESFSGVVFECLSLQHSWCLLSYPKVALGVNCFSFFFYTVLRERILEVETASREEEALLIATTHFDVWVKFCCSCCLVAKSCMTLCDPMDYRLPDSSVHGISQAGTLEWVAVSFPRGSSWPRDQTRVSCIGKQILDCWATREGQG